MNRNHLGTNQKKILEILIAYPESTVLEIAEIVYGKKIKHTYLHSSPEYSSINRSLRTLKKRGLVERVGGRIRWRLRKTP